MILVQITNGSAHLMALMLEWVQRKVYHSQTHPV